MLALVGGYFKSFWTALIRFVRCDVKKRSSFYWILTKEKAAESVDAAIPQPNFNKEFLPLIPPGVRHFTMEQSPGQFHFSCIFLARNLLSIFDKDFLTHF